MRRLSILLVGIILATAACSSSGSTEDTAQRRCYEVNKDLVDAQAAVEQTEAGTPDRKAANETVASLEEEKGTCLHASDSTTTTAGDSTTTTTEVVEEDPVSGLPIVEGGDPANPTPGSETNTDPRTPAVRDGDIVTGWRGLDHLLGNDSTYVDCANSTVPGLSWERDVPWYKSVERHGQDTRFIMAINSKANLSDDAIRQIASQDVGEDVSHLEILRVAEIVNTRGFNSGHCEQFIDRRSIVRVSLGRVVFNPNGTIQGLANDGGIFVDCHNPWRLTAPTNPTPGTTTPGSPDNPPPPSGGGKDHRLSPVTDNPNDPCEACRPNTSEPPRTTPTTATPVTVPTPVTVAPPPPSPTTTQPPRPPGPGCVDPDGAGVCESAMSPSVELISVTATNSQFATTA